MKVEHEEKSGKGVFYIEQDGQWLGEMIYGISDNKVMTIYHTEVAEALQGKHAGMQLVKAGVEYARENHIKILPLCSFAKAIIDKVEAFHSVLA